MRDAPILILDETKPPALDAFAEYEIYDRFAETYRRENDYFYLSSLLNSFAWQVIFSSCKMEH